MKPKHRGGYSESHAELCERTLVTLLRGLGPWKQGIYLAGGLVPRYLIPIPADEQDRVPHAGTTDVDLVLDLEILADVEAYKRMEQNLKDLGLERGTNDDGQRQHFSWRSPTGSDISIVVDLLCDAPDNEGGKIQAVPGERRLSALGIHGAHLVTTDYIEVSLTAELIGNRGVATETVRVANIVPFLVLKLLAYDDRAEPKDAYDIIYCLENYRSGPDDVAAQILDRLKRWPDEALITRALDVLNRRFASDAVTSGSRKDGPTSYATFMTDPGRRELDARHRQDAAAVVEAVLHGIGWHRE